MPVSIQSLEAQSFLVVKHDDFMFHIRSLYSRSWNDVIMATTQERIEFKTFLTKAAADRWTKKMIYNHLEVNGKIAFCEGIF